MVIITDYNDESIKVNEDYKNIFFLDKDGLSVSGSGGKLVLKNNGSTYAYAKSDIKEPSKVTLDEIVVVIRQYIDNE